jgi:hypothetical protein
MQTKDVSIDYRLCGSEEIEMGLPFPGFESIRRTQAHRGSGSYHAIRCTPFWCAVVGGGKQWEHISQAAAGETITFLPPISRFKIGFPVELNNHQR